MTLQEQLDALTARVEQLEQRVQNQRIGFQIHIESIDAELAECRALLGLQVNRVDE